MGGPWPEQLGLVKGNMKARVMLLDPTGPVRELHGLARRLISMYINCNGYDAVQKFVTTQYAD